MFQGADYLVKARGNADIKLNLALPRYVDGFARRANHFYSFAPSRPKEGRWPSSRTLDGMQWTFSSLRTNGAKADGEAVWS